MLVAKQLTAVVKDSKYLQVFLDFFFRQIVNILSFLGLKRSRPLTDIVIYQELSFSIHCCMFGQFSLPTALILLAIPSSA